MVEFSLSAELDAIFEAIARPPTQILTVSALAGAGKSTMLKRAAGGPLADKRIRYFVFNNRNAREAEGEFGENTAISTAHAYALRARHPDTDSPMGEIYRNRLTYRMYAPLRNCIDGDPKLTEAIRRVQSALRIPTGKAVMALQMVLRSYLQDAHIEIRSSHIPEKLSRSLFRQKSSPDFEPLIALAVLAWERMRDPSSNFPIDPAVYMKLASIEPQKIGTDIIFFDEAQDATPAMLRIIEAQMQYGTRLLLVGDSHQRIYEFTGAVDAMERTLARFPDRTLSLPLSGSWRFGQEIADAANILLSCMGSGQMLKGLGSPGKVGDAKSRFDCALFRSNGELLNAAISSIQVGKSVHIVGGVNESADMLEAMAALYSGKFSAHPEFAFFSNWNSFMEYAGDIGSASSVSLLPLARMVESNPDGIGAILTALRASTTDPDEADFVLSTAHKAKGGQWDRVLIGGDFVRQWEGDNSRNRSDDSGIPEMSELRLQYVAMTRARKILHGGGMFEAMRNNAVEHGRLGQAARIDQVLCRTAQRSMLDEPGF